MFNLIKIGIITIRFSDLIDITLTALLLHYTYLWLRKTRFFIFLILFFILLGVWQIVKALDLTLLSFVLGQISRLAVLAIIILFAPELRRALMRLPRAPGLAFLTRRTSPEFELEAFTEELIRTLMRLSRTQTGALIVLLREMELPEILQTGEQVNAQFKENIVVSIFQKSSPLHDGAIMVRDNIILAARCVLPISDDPDLPAELGLRHRAAIGITEISDALAFVVSEETGLISVAHQGNIKRNVSEEEIRRFLEQFYEF